MIATLVTAYTMTEGQPNDTVVIVEHKGRYYRAPLRGMVLDFEPIDPADTIMGPVMFTSEMEAAHTQMEEKAKAHCGPDIYAHMSFEDAVQLWFYRQAYGHLDDGPLSFQEANEGAIESSGDYPTAAADVLPSAKYIWGQGRRGSLAPYQGTTRAVSYCPAPPD